ncbi:uromodulin-like 1 [Pelodytes ibericus]
MEQCVTSFIVLSLLLEIGISPLSYHVCDTRVTKNVSKLVVFQKPYETKTRCHGWIPWRMCSRKHYKIEYHTIQVPEITHVDQCCDGYEIVGEYCALSLERFSGFTERPGMCPASPRQQPGPNCTQDFDCPLFQKCCFLSNTSFCVTPRPPALDRNTIKYWYIGSITIKTDYQQLRQADPGFFNHSRLLHAMITGELSPLQVSVYHLSTAPEGSFSVQSQVLVGTNESHSLQYISLKMDNIMNRLPEVINIQMEDVDECLHPRLSSCLPNEICTNLNGSFTCTPVSNHSTTNCSLSNNDCSVFSNHSISNVSASGFCVHWGTDCPLNYTYTVKVSAASGFNYRSDTRRTAMSVTGLAAGELYSVSVSLLGCKGPNYTWEQNVKTDAQMLNGTLKITNWQLTEALLNKTSPEYLDFEKKFVEEVKNSLSKEISAEKLTVKVESLSAGSLIVNFQIILNDTEVQSNITSLSFSSANKSSVFQVDPTSVKITDFDECLSPLDNDCDKNAECKNLDVSYTCECRKPYADSEPTRPGRNCKSVSTQGVSAWDSANTLVSTVMADTSEPTTWYTKDFTGSMIQTSTVSESSIPETYKTLSSTHILADFNSSHAQLETTAKLPTHSTTGDHDPETATLINPNFTAHKEDIKMNTPTEHTTITSLQNSTKEFPTHSAPGSLDMPSTPVENIEPVMHEKVTSSSGDNVTGISVLSTTTELPMHFPTGNDNVETSTPKGVDTYSSSGYQSTTYIPKSNQTLTDAPQEVTATSTTTKKTGATFSLCITDSSNMHVGPTPALISTQTKTISPAMSLKDASELICEVGKIGIRIPKAYLKMKTVTADSMYLGSPQCSVNCITDTHVVFQARWEDCGTNVYTVNNNTVANTTLYIKLPSPNRLGYSPIPIGAILCTFKNEIWMSTGYSPSGGFFTVIESLEGDGTFTPEFQIFNGDEPISRNFTLSASDDVKIQIRIKTEDPQFKVVISDCWATPTESSQDAISFPFIKNSCVLPNTYTSILTNGISNNASFQTKIFSFVNNPVVYLHCKLHVCQEVLPGRCKPSCDGFRSVRSSGNILTSVTRMGPLLQARRSHATESPKDPSLGPGYIALIIVAVFACVACVAAILVCWHQRRTGNYNFKMKSEDVGYKVFSN